MFEDAEVIYSYGDEQAVEDGILVAVSKIDRVTVAVWAWLEEHLPEDAPPSGWPVDLMGWFGGDKPLAAAKGLIGTHGPQARKVWDENIGGGVYQLWAQDTGGEIVALHDYDAPGRTNLWLIPNEVGGVTLMFPNDY